MTDPIAQLCQLIAEMLGDNPAMSQADLVSRVEEAIASNPELAAALKTDDRMQQINRDGAKGFQTLAKDSSRVFIEGTHYHLSDSEKLKAVLESVLQKLQPTEPKVIDFQAYLQSILDDEDYREWQEVYTPTTVEGKKQPPQPKYSPRLKLRVETVKPKKEEKKEENQREQVEQWEALAGLRQYAIDHVLLIGKPGSGKSTSLERLLWEEANNTLSHPNAKIPVLVKLRRCTSTIEGLIQDFFSRHYLSLSIADIEYLLHQGKLLLLLDGLNELPETFRTTITNFRDKYRSTTPMIVSTRDLGVGGNLNIKKTLKMLPLTERQMQEFVRGYLEEEGDRLFQQLKGDRLRKFAETPLLLWMLCRVFAQNGQVPANLGLAFREFTQLYDQKIQEDAPAESRDQWPKLLRHLAFALMHDKDPVEFRLSMSREEAENLLTEYLQQEGRANARDCAERWLQDLLDYHLIQPVIQPNFEEHIEFRHQLIQEYYAAEYLLRLLPELSDEQLKRDYLNYLKWTEPIALMLALVNDEERALRVVKLATGIDRMLAARLAGKVQQGFQEQTVKFVEELTIPDWLKIKILGETRSDFAITELRKVLEDEQHNYHARKSAANALITLGSDSALKLINKLKDKDPGMYRSVVLRNPSVERDVSSLSSPLEGDNNDIPYTVDIPHTVVEKLGTAIASSLNTPEGLDCNLRGSVADVSRKLTSDEEIIAEIKNLENPDEEVRRSAADTLGNSKAEEAIPELSEVLKKDGSWEVRQSAASALGQIGSTVAIPDLLNVISSGVPVAGDAAKALGQIDSDDTIPALLKALESGNPEVRLIVAYKLSSFKSNRTAPILPDLFRFLLTKSGEDAFDTIRAIQNRCKFYNYEIFHSIIPQGKTISLYFSYAPADEALQTQLANHLTLLERQSVITSWNQRQILPGDDRTQVINQQLNTADIILLLISANSLVDNTCYDLEIQRAIERHQAGEARVIPILLRPVYWANAPFSQLNVLPKNRQPVTSWPNPDKAFQEIVQGIREVAMEVRREKKKDSPS